jgi:hypothetical protein
MTPDQLDALDDATWLGCLDVMDSEANAIRAQQTKRR